MGVPDGQRWLSSLPRIAAELCEAWQLSDLHPVAGGTPACMFSAVRGDALPVTLKISPPSHPIAAEALALGVWRGDAAPRLLAADPLVHAVLVERMTPGPAPASLTAEDAADLLQRLAAPAPARLPELRQLVERRFFEVTCLRERSDRPDLPVELLAQAKTAADKLLADSSRNEVVHGDFQARNIVVCDRRGISVVDAPSAARGDRCYDAALFVVGENDAAPVGDGVSVFAEVCDLAAERIRCWAAIIAVCEAHLAAAGSSRAQELVAYANELCATCAA